MMQPYAEEKRVNFAQETRTVGGETVHREKALDFGGRNSTARRTPARRDLRYSTSNRFRQLWIP